MYRGIIQTAITKKLSLELDYRRPPDTRTEVTFDSSSDTLEGYDRPQSREIEIDRLLSLI